MKATKAISYVTAALVLFLAVGAFVLSYDALQALALDNGVTDGLAWLWPLLVDGAVVVFSLAVLRGSLLGERTRYPWSLVGAFVALSVAFNVLHAPEDLLARVIAAVPPVALALAFELFTGQVKAEVTRHGAVLTLADLTHQIAERRSELSDLDQRADQTRARVEAIQDQIAGLQQERLSLKQAVRPGSFVHSATAPGCSANRLTTGSRRAEGANGPVHKQPGEQSDEERQVNLDQANSTRQEQIELRRRQLAGLVDQDMTQTELAAALGVSVTTIKRDLQVLRQSSHRPASEAMPGGQVLRPGSGQALEMGTNGKEPVLQ